MKQKFKSLRVKITTMAILILVCNSVLLTLSSKSSSDLIFNAIDTTPSTTNSASTTSPIPSLQFEESTDNQAALLSVPAMKVVKTNVQMRMWGTLFLSILVSTLLLYFYTKHLLKPLEALTKQVQSIDVTTMQQPLSITATTFEIEQLSHSFKRMLQRIHNAFVMQKNFSSNVAHELRTPLATLQTQLDVFELKANEGFFDTKEVITQLKKHTLRLTDIVTELLELTNEQSLPLNQTISLVDLIDELLLELDDFAISQNITITFQNKENTSYPMIEGNDQLIERALFNLLENAVKYNRANGEVILELHETADHVRLTIHDTGIGIPTSMHEQIFEPFYRVDKSRSREIGGSGLGLALVKKILETHKATIEVANRKPYGTSFTITFLRHQDSIG